MSHRPAHRTAPARPVVRDQTRRIARARRARGYGREERAAPAREPRASKAGSDLEAFKREDEAFHDELVKLLQASKRNDLPGATKQLGTVLEGCTSCHQKYRF
ncbi:MAG: hypothetical protein DYH12_13115 [Sorangiineae bacterium PRO1]|nr:hypothetical protein [Sorangiineae bacterium PRO1]